MFDCSRPIGDSYKCDDCVYQTNIKVTLQIHKNVNWRYDRAVVDKKSCGACAFQAFSALVLDRHEKKCQKAAELRQSEAALGSDPRSSWRKCEFCEHKSRYPSGLKQHVLARHTPKEALVYFTCDACDYRTKEKIRLKRHVLVKHNGFDHRRLKCHLCDYRCPNKSRLQQHVIARHTDLEEIKWFHCPDCDYKSKRRSGLTIHVRMKHKDNPEIEHGCKDCEFKTKSVYSLEKHIMKKHPTQETQWLMLCEKCGDKSRTIRQLENHYRLKHNAAL